MKNKLIYFFPDDFNTSKAHFQKKLFEDGVEVKKDDPIALIESSKKIQEILANETGIIYWLINEGDFVSRGDLIAVISHEKMQKADLDRLCRKTDDEESYDVDLSFKLVKEAKKFQINQQDLKNNKIVTLEALYKYIQNLWGIEIQRLNGNQQKLANSLSPNLYTSFVNVEISNTLIKEKIKKLSDENNIEVSLDVLFIYLIKNVMKDFTLVNSWIVDEDIYRDCNRNVGIYLTNGIENGVPIEVPGDLESIKDIAINVYEQLTAIAKEEPLRKLPCAIYLSNLSKTKANVVVPMLKKDTSSTMVLTINGDKMIFGYSFDHRIFEGNYAIAFLEKIIEAISKL